MRPGIPVYVLPKSKLYRTSKIKIVFNNLRLTGKVVSNR